MYHFTLLDEEEIIKIFDELMIRQGDKQKLISAILTNKRLLLFEFVDSDPIETLRTARGVSPIRNKEVSYIINLDSIESIRKDDYYLVTLKDNVNFEFNSEELYLSLKSFIS